MFLITQYTIAVLFSTSCLATFSQIQSGNNDFATKLYTAVSKNNENVLFSPLSVHLLLTLCYQGASGATLDNLRDILHLPDNQTEAASQYAKIITEYNKSERDAVVLMANNVFVNANYKLRPSFHSIAKEYFTSDVESIDFTKKSSVSEINEWVAKKTNSKIKNIISDTDLDEDTRLVLINAIYFKSPWLKPFKMSLTYQDTFHISDTYSVNCEMMRTNGAYYYGEIRDLDAKILKLPYANGFYFVVILPNNITGIETIEKGLDRQGLMASTINSVVADVEVFLPKFKIEMSGSLNENLEEVCCILGLLKFMGLKFFSLRKRMK